MAGWGSIHRNTLNSMAHQMQRLARIQEQIATGSRVIRASDAPTDAFRVLSLQAEEKRYGTYTRNLETVTDNLNHVANTLQEVTREVASIQTRLTQGANATYSQADRQAIGEEIDGLLEQAIALVNSPSMGRQLFGGSDTTTAPYRAVRENGKIVRVVYEGADQALRVPTGPGVEMRASVVGDDVFRGRGQAQPEMLGTTGAAAGAGTSTVRGHLWLDVLHGTTTYTNAVPAPPHDSGVRAGLSSDDGDTIVGSHTLTIDTSGPDPTVRLDDGPEVAFTTADSDLRLRNADGQVAYVDLTGWDGGDAVIDLSSSAALSIDGGASSVAVDFTANQAVTHAETGQVLYVDTTHLREAGAEPVRVTGSYDLFDTLIHLRDLLTNTRQLDAAEQGEQLREMTGTMDAVLEGLARHLAAVGGTIQAAETMKTSMDDMSYNAETQRAAIADADVAELAANLAQAQTYYQMVLASSGKLLNLSLLHYID